MRWTIKKVANEDFFEVRQHPGRSLQEVFSNLSVPRVGIRGRWLPKIGSPCPSSMDWMSGEPNMSKDSWALPEPDWIGLGRAEFLICSSQTWVLQTFISEPLSSWWALPYLKLRNVKFLATPEILDSVFLCQQTLGFSSERTLLWLTQLSICCYWLVVWPKLKRLN